MSMHTGMERIPAPHCESTDARWMCSKVRPVLVQTPIGERSTGWNWRSGREGRTSGI